MMTMHNQVVDEVLVTHCVHCRNHNAVETRVTRDNKLVGLPKRNKKDTTHGQ